VPSRAPGASQIDPDTGREGGRPRTGVASFPKERRLASGAREAANARPRRPSKDRLPSAWAARGLADLLAREHAALADFLVALSDFDRERRWLELGHASLFSFLHRELGLSKGAASYRNAAAALLQRCPGVVAPLRSGSFA
jgi:hypothetical protein